MSETMHVLIGLGNPGARYQYNRHNIGFMALDAIAQRYEFAPARTQFNAVCRVGTIPTPLFASQDIVKVLCVYPQTYMNESGKAVQKILQFYKVSVAQTYVIHDELDLTFGKMRLKTGGGIAGHNGLRSIRQVAGADFHRVRMGIDHPGDKARVHDYVLSNFSKEEAIEVDLMCEKLADNIALLFADTHDLLQTRLNTL